MMPSRSAYLYGLTAISWTPFSLYRLGSPSGHLTSTHRSLGVHVLQTHLWLLERALSREVHGGLHGILRIGVEFRDLLLGGNLVVRQVFAQRGDRIGRDRRLDFLVGAVRQAKCAELSDLRSRPTRMIVEAVRSKLDEGRSFAGACPGN